MRRSPKGLRRGYTPATKRSPVDQGESKCVSHASSCLLAMMAIAAVALTAPSAFAASASQHDSRSVEPQLPHTAPELQVREETSNVLCAAVAPAAGTVPSPTVTSGGCKAHVRGHNIRLIAHVGGGVEVQVSSCNWEFEVRIDSTGRGWLTHQEFTDGEGGAGACTRHPCPQLPEPAEPAESKAWGFSLRERGMIAPRETFTFIFCFSNRDDEHGSQTHCELEVPFTETEAGVATNHRYHFNANPADPVTGGIPCHHSPTTEEPRAEFIGEFNAENGERPRRPRRRRRRAQSRNQPHLTYAPPISSRRSEGPRSAGPLVGPPSPAQPRGYRPLVCGRDRQGRHLRGGLRSRRRLEARPTRPRAVGIGAPTLDPSRRSYRALMACSSDGNLKSGTHVPPIFTKLSLTVPCLPAESTVMPPKVGWPGSL